MKQTEPVAEAPSAQVQAALVEQTAQVQELEVRVQAALVQEPGVRKRELPVLAGRRA